MSEVARRFAPPDDGAEPGSRAVLSRKSSNDGFQLRHCRIAECRQIHFCRIGLTEPPAAEAAITVCDPSPISGRVAGADERLEIAARLRQIGQALN